MPLDFVVVRASFFFCCCGWHGGGRFLAGNRLNASNPGVSCMIRTTAPDMKDGLLEWCVEKRKQIKKKRKKKKHE